MSVVKRDYSVRFIPVHTPLPDASMQKYPRFQQVCAMVDSSHQTSWFSLAACHDAEPTLELDLPETGDQFMGLFTLSDFLDLPTAEESIDAVLSRAALDMDQRKAMSRNLMFLSHYAAIDAQKKGVGFGFSLTIITKTVHLYDEAAVVREDEDGGDTGLQAEGSSCSQERELEKSCPICLDDFTFSENEHIVYTTCGHVYHSECIVGWRARSNGRCPVCRYEYNAVSIPTRN